MQSPQLTQQNSLIYYYNAKCLLNEFKLSIGTLSQIDIKLITERNGESIVKNVITHGISMAATNIIQRIIVTNVVKVLTEYVSIDLSVSPVIITKNC